MSAYRRHSDKKVQLHKPWHGHGPEIAQDRLNVPCGGCLGCRKDQALAWSLRCHLELLDHDRASFVTLTYSDENLPATLSVQHTQRFLKRLRKERSVRFFLSGEYGERTRRPHYHAILFGADETDKALLRRTWGHGHVDVRAATPRSIAYTVGYVRKKLHERRKYSDHISQRIDRDGEQLDCGRARVTPDGETYYLPQPPFHTMSRRPGIGSERAKRYPQSWRSYAVHGGRKLPVPRFLHEQWLKQASPLEIEELEYHKHCLNLTVAELTDLIASLGRSYNRLRTVLRKSAGPIKW